MEGKILKNVLKDKINIFPKQSKSQTKNEEVLKNQLEKTNL